MKQIPFEKLLSVLLCALCLISCRQTYDYQPPAQTDDGWPTASLDDVGMDESLLCEAVDRVRDNTYENVHSILIVKDGQLVFEVYFAGYQWAYDPDGQYRGARGCLGKEVKGNGMATLNLGGDRTWRDRSGRTRYSGYVHDSIREFAENVRFLMTGGTLEQLKGTYADARDGLEVTRIAEAAHQSLGTGEPVAIERATA